MERVNINGFAWLYNRIAMTLHELDNPASYTTINHLTPNERLQLYNHLKYNQS